jgi:DNA-binding GntR family transcriptional regulator
MRIVSGKGHKKQPHASWAKHSYDRVATRKKSTDANGTQVSLESLRIPLSEEVYRAIRTGIEVGRFVPGERMLEVELAEMLGVSRTPVREAVRRLISEGLLTLASARGVIVTQLDEAKVIELYAMLEVLEGTAAEFAANRASDSDIEHLQAILEKEEKALGNLDGTVRLNDELHRAVYVAAHNRYLTSSVRWLSDSLNLLRGSTLVEPDRQRSSHEEHTQIVAAIRRRDPEIAGAVARQHIREARRLRVKILFDR